MVNLSVLYMPQSVLYCYGQYNNIVSKFKNDGINVCSGPPSNQKIDAFAKPSIIIANRQDECFSYGTELTEWDEIQINCSQPAVEWTVKC